MPRPIILCLLLLSAPLWAQTDNPSPRPTETPVVTPSEFREISFSLRPGLTYLAKNPGGWTDPAFSLSGAISLFLHPRVALNVPYAFTRYGSVANIHTAGGGPLFRYLDTDRFRGSIEASLLYVRARKGNRLGWSAGTDLTFGFRRSKMRPFFGPFFRYDYVFLPGTNLRSYTLGVGLTLTDLADRAE